MRQVLRRVVATLAAAAATATLAFDGRALPTCGGKPVVASAPDVDTAEFADVEQRWAAARLVRVVERLRADGDVLGAAAALALQVAARLKCEDTACAFEAAVPTSPIVALARLAAASTDPSVYAWALGACERAVLDTAATAACAQLSTARQAQLDPDNGWPWLFEFVRARGANDAAGAGAALARAAQASVWRHPGARIGPVVVRAAPLGGDDHDALAMLLGSSVAPIAFWPLPSFRPLLEECAAASPVSPASPASPASTVTAATCVRVAERLLAGADSLLVLGLAVRLAERVGLPAERVQAAQRENAALLAWVQAPADAASDWADRCAWLARTKHLTLRSMVIGELPALRELAATAAPR